MLQGGRELGEWGISELGLVGRGRGEVGGGYVGRILLGRILKLGWMEGIYIQGWQGMAGYWHIGYARDVKRGS